MDGSPTEFSCDGRLASHGQGGQAVRTTNRLLCDIDIGPDGDVVEIGDVGAQRGMSTYVRAGFDFDGTDDLPRHALWVHTMNCYECDLIGKLVRVRIMAGADVRGLGQVAFDGELHVPSGILAVGGSRNPTRHLLFGSPTVVRVRVFTPREPEAIHFTNALADYPASGPGSVNLLLPPNPGFAQAVGNTTVGRIGPIWRGLRRPGRH